MKKSLVALVILGTLSGCTSQTAPALLPLSKPPSVICEENGFLPGTKEGYACLSRQNRAIKSANRGRSGVDWTRIGSAGLGAGGQGSLSQMGAMSRAAAGLPPTQTPQPRQPVNTSCQPDGVGGYNCTTY
jgi:hypothetical protein